MDEKSARAELEKEMVNGAGNNKGISSAPVVIKVFSPDVINLSLIDLPGITKIPVGDQPSDIESRIIEMIKLYIQNPNTLILAISPGNYDIANSDALKLAKEIDPQGQRTLGIVTKLDLIEDERSMLGLMDGTVHPLELGYIGLRCRNQKELEQGQGIKECHQIEANFFNNPKSVFYEHKNRMGTPYLLKQLSSFLSQQIKKCLPLLRTKLQGMIQEKEKEMKNFGKVYETNNDPSSKAAQLISLLNKYNKNFTETLSGEYFIENDLCGGAKINYILDNVFKRKVYELDPYGEMKDDEVQTQIRNVCGLNPSQIISDKAFEILVRKQIEALKGPSLECVMQVYQELRRISVKVSIADFEVFQNLGKAITEVMEDIIKRMLGPTEHMIEQIFKIEKGFINTKHPDFIHQRELILSNRAFNTMSTKTLSNVNENAYYNVPEEKEDEKENGFWGSLFSKDKPKRQHSQPNPRNDIFNLGSPNDFIRQREKEELETIKKLVNCYQQIVKKNLIDYVPKTVITLLINQTTAACEEELVGRLYQGNKIDSMLQKNEEAYRKQQESANNLNLFKKCLDIIENVDAKIL